MIEYPALVPFAVAAAVVLFLAKELIEAARRWKANGRKLHAIRRFLAAECERNSFAIERMLSQTSDIQEALDDGRKVRIEEPRIDQTRLVIEADNGFASSPVPIIHTEALKDHLFEAASLDAYLFEVMESALDTLIDAAHVRDGVIGYVVDDPIHLDGFKDFAHGDLNDALDAVRALYFKCTNEPLARGRVR